jgi:hypothetical protein
MKDIFVLGEKVDVPFILFNKRISVFNDLSTLIKENIIVTEEDIYFKKISKLMTTDELFEEIDKLDENNLKQLKENIDGCSSLFSNKHNAFDSLLKFRDGSGTGLLNLTKLFLYFQLGTSLGIYVIDGFENFHAVVRPIIAESLAKASNGIRQFIPVIHVIGDSDMTIMKVKEIDYYII